MITGYCRTNLDEYQREEWPRVFVAVPRIGERVEAESRRSLKVCGITHKIRRNIGSYRDSRNEPFIEVELNL